MPLALIRENRTALKTSLEALHASVGTRACTVAEKRTFADGFAKMADFDSRITDLQDQATRADAANKHNREMGGARWTTSVNPSDVYHDPHLEVCCSHRTVTQEGRISPEEEGS